MGMHDLLSLLKKSMRKSNKESKNKIKWILINRKISILEKNIQNQVTKYKINLEADVAIKSLSSDKKLKKYFSEKTYDVEDRYSITVKNSKQANNSLL